ncbi:MAG: hypothetical protein Q7U10_08745 [Thermodesulfovibrionia bacterium]|nr:hypothetical protein [Thermodesulfovibrionia bacterium]
MVLSVFGTVFGFLTSFAPNLLKFWQDKRDKDHELKVMELQMQAQAQGHMERLEEINAEADIAESKALYQSAQVTLSGVSWVDATLTFLNSSVRPIITYSFFGVYTWVKAEQYAVANDISKVWTAEDMAIFCTIISFWFGSRSMRYYFGKKS